MRSIFTGSSSPSAQEAKSRCEKNPSPEHSPENVLDYLGILSYKIRHYENKDLDLALWPSNAIVIKFNFCKFCK